MRFIGGVCVVLRNLFKLYIPKMGIFEDSCKI